jgi:outer membrane protein assembly factor BamA
MRASLAAAALALAVAAACGAPPPPAKPTPPPSPGAGSGTSAASDPAAPPVATTWEQLHGKIASFAITGADDMDYLRLQPIFNDEIGKPLDRGRLRAKLDRLMESQTLTDVQITGEQVVDGIRLIARVVPQPKVVSLVMHDAAGQTIPLPPQLQSTVGARLAPEDLDRVVAALRDEYAGEGNVGFSATWHDAQSGDGVVVTIDTNPGERLTITAHVYDGAKGVKSADLDRALDQNIAVGTPWIPEQVERAALLVERYYWNHGYAQVSVTIGAQPEHNPAPVTFQIKEGDVFRLGAIEVTGVAPADAKRYLAMAKLKAGAVFSRDEIAAAREAINNDVIQQGHPKAEVLPLTKIDAKKKTIGLTFEVTAEPKPGS